MWRSKGFTLLELLVALALVSVLAAALYGTYFGLMSGRERAQAVADRSRDLRETLDLLRRELSSAFYSDAKSPSDPDKPLYRFVVEDRDLFGAPASTLTFSTLAPPDYGSIPMSDQVEVEYRPVAKDKSMNLMRRSRELYMPQQTMLYPRMEEIDGFLVECFDGGKWVRSWDARLNGGRLPKQVRITVTVRDRDKLVPYVAVVAPRVGA